MNTQTTSRTGWIALFAISLAVFVAALDLTVTAAVLPQLIFDFNIPLPSGLADAAWIVNGYLIAYVVAMPNGDHAKHRKRAITIGEALGLYSDYPTAKGCTSPFAPIWIEEMVKRQG